MSLNEDFPVINTRATTRDMSGNKKRQSQSTPDFQKKKSKVGKGKRPAENATDATFTTGRIVISSQLQLPDKNEIVSKRKLPVKVNTL